MMHHQALQIVLDASKTAWILAPGLSVQRLNDCHAVYHPFKHRILVDDRLANGLELNSLRALLAHEVGHAAQRKDLMRLAATFGVPVFVIFVVAMLAMLTSGTAGTTTQMGLVFVFFVMVMVAWHRFAMPRWWKIVARREREADLFAESFVGSPGVMTRLAGECRHILNQA